MTVYAWSDETGQHFDLQDLTLIEVPSEVIALGREEIETFVRWHVYPEFEAEQSFIGAGKSVWCQLEEYFVNTYLLDKVYGGPEEGGWWYNCGTPIAHRRVLFPFYHWLFKKWRDASIKEMALDLEAGSGPRYYFAGDFPTYHGTELSVSIDSEFPEPYPQERPHYE